MFHSTLLPWLTACYREDRSKLGIRDFFSSSKVKNRRMSSGEEHLLNLEFDHELLAPKYGESAHAFTEMHKRERELVYGAIFVCGKMLGGVHRAPLVLFNADVDYQNYYALKVRLKSARINGTALDALGGDKDFERELRELISGVGLDTSVVADIQRLIDRYCPEADAENLLQWPHLVSSKVVDEAGTCDQVSVLSAAGLGNVERSVSTRGVLQELTEMADYSSSEFSDGIKILLGEDPALSKATDERVFFIPASLSAQQQKVLLSARKYPLTVCHGPPGTGKSYTVAAIALDHIVRGQSVLVTSRNDHAVNVMHEKIDAMIGGAYATVRAGRREHLKDLKGFLSLILNGGGDFAIKSMVSLEHLQETIHEKITLIEDAENVLEDEYKKSIERGDRKFDPSPNLLVKLQRVFDNYSLKRRPVLSEIHQHYKLLQAEREKLVAEYVSLQRRFAVTKLLGNRSSRAELKKFLAAIRKLKGSAQELAMRDIDLQVILETFPVWLSSAEDVHRVLPFKKELFDVVIIDESSQCDLASILPVLQRAKRVVVVGDTKQLRHVSFLSNHSMQEFGTQFSVTPESQMAYNFRNRSLMDVAIDCIQDHSNTGYLDEHFRSHYGIIEFSNQRFYHKQLKVMRDRPWALGRGAGAEAGTIGHFTSNGERDSKGVNGGEVSAICDWLREFLLKPDRYSGSSIGVLSPFRAQVDALTKAVFEEFRGTSLQSLLNKHDLLIGTAHSFQGEERDIMLMSLCVDARTSSASVRFLEREDVFNVAVTRARNEQHVFHLIEAKDLKLDSLLSQYLTHVTNEEYLVSNIDNNLDAFSRDVSASLQARGLDCKLGASVAGVDVDLVVEHKGETTGIDLIGYPGATQPAISLRKVMMLGRAGLNVIPLGYLEWSMRQEECVQSIQRLCAHSS